MGAGLLGDGLDNLAEGSVLDGQGDNLVVERTATGNGHSSRLAQLCTDILEPGAEHPEKAGPCVKFAGLEDFVRLRLKLDGCLTGARLAKDRAAEALSKVMVREALDYPA